MMGTKSDLRHRILRLRDGLSASERRIHSEMIAARLAALERWKNARSVFTYVSFRSEVETWSIMEMARREGKVLAVPFTDYARNVIIPSVIDDPEKDLAPARFGIMEPTKDHIRPLEAGEIDITLVPGSVFDLNGGRIGYGMGFYDRLLPQLRSDCLKIALAFEVQIVPEAPRSDHDYCVEMIITEGRIVAIP
ncbi:MAG: 5-formyltetrahydrofolate cyclo-ligase [Pseudomonadota bacterium]